MKVPATLLVNGTAYPVEVDAHVSLLRAVREEIGLTGSKEGCDDSECGACMMLLDGKPLNSCSYFALQAEGREVTTVEGLADGDRLSDLQAAFLRESGGVIDLYAMDVSEALVGGPIRGAVKLTRGEGIDGDSRPAWGR